MSGLRVLIVEDEKIVAEDLRDRLLSLGYEVPAVTKTGEGAIAQALSLKPDFILMDIGLKGPMDGTEAAKSIHERLDVPIIYLTAHADDQTLQRAMTTDPFGYLLKPVGSRELHTAISMGHLKHQLEKSLRESEQWLETTLRSIGDGVIATDDRGSIKFMNPVAELLTGWSSAEALGRNLQDVFTCVPGADRAIRLGAEAPPAAPAELITGHAGHRIVVSRDGTRVPVDDNIATMRDARGRVSGFVIVFKDATSRKRTEEALRNVSKRILEAQEAERRRVARELHDSVIQMLSSVKFRLKMVEEKIAGPGKLQAREITRVNDILGRAIKELRRISRNLRPSELDDLGLTAAVQIACEEFQERTGIRADFGCESLPGELSPGLSLAVYRVFQEALANVEKHSAASSVTVRVICEGPELVLTIKDDGKGFDPAGFRHRAGRNSGMGLVDMVERVEYLGGTIRIDTAARYGTEISARLPLAGPTEEER